MKNHHCTLENAPKFLDWLKSRGGIAIWNSIDLSDFEKSWSTPAFTDGKPTEKPSWKSASKPERVITNAAEIDVCFDKEVKRFRVAIRGASNGLSFKVTSASTQRIRAAVEKAGEKAYYKFDYGTQEAVIMAPDKIVLLSEWETREQVMA